MSWIRQPMPASENAVRRGAKDWPTLHCHDTGVILNVLQQEAGKSGCRHRSPGKKLLK